MNERELEDYCRENAVPFKRQKVDGVERLRIMDKTVLPMVLREACDEQGFLKAEEVVAADDSEAVNQSEESDETNTHSSEETAGS